MSDEVEALGTAAEGALLGAAVEREREGGGKGKEGGTVCLNCGAALTGAYCSNCGQKADIHRSLAAIWHDIAHGVLHFDGKLWRTLPMLAFKPGQLTRRYIHGERAGFISPMALFLFSIFLMFAIFSFTGGPGLDSGTSESLSSGLDEQLEKNETDIARLEEDVTTGRLEGSALEKAEADLAGLKRESNSIAMARAKPLPYPDAGLGQGAAVDNKAESSGGPITGTLTTTTTSGEVIQTSNDFATGWKWLDDALIMGAQKANKEPKLLLYKLQSNGYKFAWLLIPLSLPFVWLVTAGAGGSLRAYRFYDHAVFATYSLSFMSLLFLVCALFSRIGQDWAWAALGIISPIHLYKQLKNSYGLSRTGALLRLFLLLICINIILTLFFLILLLLGILG